MQAMNLKLWICCAVLFLSISTFIEFLCIFLYAYVFPQLPIVKYYRSKAASEGSKTVAADLAAAGIHTEASKLSIYIYIIGKYIHLNNCIGSIFVSNTETFIR